VTMVGQVSKIVLQFGGVIVLARLLSPTDYGLLAMVLSIIGVGEVLRDFGLSSAAIQARQLSRAQRDNLFWINSGIGILLAGLAVALAHPISALYNRPELTPITMVLALTFVANGMVTQFRASLLRDLRFGAIAGLDVVALVLGLAAGILGAILGMGYWALVLQQLVQAFVVLVGAVVLARWVPGLPNRRGSVRPFLRFGWGLAGSNLLNYAANNADSIVIGTQLGASVLGIYNRAFQLLMVPITQLNAPATRVALPVLSRLQEEPARFNAYLIRAQSVLVHVLLIAFAVAFAQAEALIGIALGAQWMETVPIFRILILGGAFYAMGYATYWVFLAYGETRRYLRFAVVTRPIQIGLIALGAVWGVIGVAVSYAGGLALAWAFGLWWLSRVVPSAPIREMLATVLRALAVYVCAGGAAFALTHLAPIPEGVLSIIVALVAVAAVAALAFLIWPGYRRDALSIVDAAKLLVTKGSKR
jgi:PST family polysaccharide transporter